MVAFSVSSDRQAEQILAHFVDSALALILEFGVDTPSVDLELDLWHALSVTYQAERRWVSRDAPLTRLAYPNDCLLNRLADAAYHVALHHGLRGSFLELELGLWHLFQLVNRDPSFVEGRTGMGPHLAGGARSDTLVTARC